MPTLFFYSTHEPNLSFNPKNVKSDHIFKSNSHYFCALHYFYTPCCAILERIYLVRRIIFLDQIGAIEPE